MATFMNSQEIEKLKPSFIEVVGYKVEEDDQFIYVANDKNGNTFKRVITVSKNSIIESTEVIPTEGIIVGEIAEINYIDTQMTGNNVSLTVEKLQRAPKPPVCEICGFVVSENEKDIALAQEKGDDGKYRGINIVPKSFVEETK